MHSARTGSTHHKLVEEESVDGAQVSLHVSGGARGFSHAGSVSWNSVLSWLAA